MKLKVQIESDWHVGSGTGIPGYTDRLILRDEESFPFIPAKTLTGLLRDSAEFVAEKLDGLAAQAAPPATRWADLVDHLFGAQPANYYRVDQRKERKEQAASPARISFGPARFSDGFRAAVLPEKRSALTFRQPGVKVEATKGKAEDKCLRFIEMARGGVCLEADANVPKLSDPEAALLCAAIGNLRHLGGKRRRGGGLCEPILDTALQGRSQAEWIAWLRKDFACIIPKKSEVAKPKFQDPVAQDLTVSSSEYLSIPLRLETLLPVIIAKSVQGNLVESLDFIPGTNLLPMLLSKLGEILGSDNRQALSAFVTNGQLVVTPFYPAVDNQMSLPVPLCLTSPKSDSGAICNRLLDPLSKDNIRRGWVSVSSHLTYYEGMDLLTPHMHNTVEDTRQRPLEEVGGVYTYQAIRSNTVFFGELRLVRHLAERLAEKEKDWWKCLSLETSIGVSKKDDYGRLRLSFTREPTKSAGSPPERTLLKGGNLVLYLQSDLLLRDNGLASCADPRRLECSLNEKLGLALTLREELSFGRSRRIESWQTHWGLPRPSLIGLQAGGVYVFRLSDPESWNDKTIAKAVALQESGLGERRAEGYGRLQLQPKWLLEAWPEIRIIQTRTVLKATTDETVALSPADQASLIRLEWRYAQAEIRRQARQRAYNETTKWKWLGIEGWDKKETTNSQWGSLRTALGRVVADPNSTLPECKEIPLLTKAHLAPLGTWVGEIKRRDNRKNKWAPECLEKLASLATNPSYEDLRIAAPLVPSCLPDLQAQLLPYAVKTLLETICEAVFDSPRKEG